MKLLLCTQVVDKRDSILGFFHGWLISFAQYFDEVYVICLKKGEYQLPPNVHVFSLGKEEGENRCKYLYRFYTYFGKLFFSKRPTYVLFHMGAVYNILAFPFFLVRKIYGTKFYWWKTHGHINFFGKLALCCVDRVYTASIESFPIDTSKRRVIGHAIACTDQKQIHTRHNSLRLACVGRLSPRKCVHHAIEVMHLLREHNISAQLSIVGDAVDVQYVETLRQLVTQYNLEDHVSFVGAVEHDALSTMYTSHDVLLHPSETGSIDKVVLEAMCGGMVPVALESAYGGILKDLGLTVSANEPALYTAVLKGIMEMSNDAYVRLQETLQSRVRSEHSLETLSERLFQHD